MAAAGWDVGGLADVLGGRVAVRRVHRRPHDRQAVSGTTFSTQFSNNSVVEDVDGASRHPASARNERNLGALMPTFNYVSGNISNLTPGGAANMTDLQGPLTDVRTALNGNLDEINVPNLSGGVHDVQDGAWGGAVSAWARRRHVHGRGTYGGPGTRQSASAGTRDGTIFVIDLDPADWLANARTTKLRLRWQCVPNAVAPATNVRSRPVSGRLHDGGASGAGRSIVTSAPS
jgi:hypothetical protein